MDGETAYNLSRFYAEKLGDEWPPWETLGAIKADHWEQMAMEKGLTDRDKSASVSVDERTSR